MADVTLLLGPIVFQEFEVPARINLGGLQRVAVHRLVGGARVIDALGRDDAEIQFAGVFSGRDATLRARAVDELRALGTPLPLSWDVFYYTVILTRFDADYRNGWWIPFRIACTVLRDEAAVLIDTAFSLAGSAISDIAAASSWASGTGIDLGPAQTALSAPNASVRGASDYVGAQASLGAAQGAVSQSIDSAGLALSGAGLDSTLSPAAGISGLEVAVSSAQQLASLATIRGYVGRAAINLSNAST